MNKEIILAGNPNVGKSSIFNILTKLKQHTGNWSGKTVELAKGSYKYKDELVYVHDLPGTYSLNSISEEENIASKFIQEKQFLTVIVCDSTMLERNLNLVLQIIKINKKVIVCLNLIDEAKNRGITIDIEKLEKLLGVPVIPTSAKTKEGITKLKETINSYQIKTPLKIKKNINSQASEIYNQVVTDNNKETRKIDKILTHKVFGLITMFCLFMLVFWITISAANVPSSLLFDFFDKGYSIIKEMLININLPNVMIDFLMEGIYKILTWVISVMLPPMAIFFPLFTFLEDFGYLPRIAFILDKAFKKCHSCGKQALTMCMGFGCNAVGVMGTRIIDSKRERLIAILTNSFVPCNGRFGTIISLIAIFIIGLNNTSNVLNSLVLTIIIFLSVIITLITSKILSKTILKGESSSYTLELPPYRRPDIKNIVIRSIFDRTLKVLYRAIICSIPAGIIIWLMLLIQINDTSILVHFTNILNPIGIVLGVDGVIIAALILGLPANEIVMPIILMIYLSTGTLTESNDLLSLQNILVNNNWNLLTAINFIVLSLFHSPCATTIKTIYKETNSKKWTILSVLIPTIIGIILTIIIKLIFTIL